MSKNKNEESETQLLPSFANQDDIMVETVQNMSSGTNEAEAFDYLQEYVNNFSSKYSCTSISYPPTNNSSTEFQLITVTNDYKNTNLYDVEHDFIKVTNISSENEINAPNELRNNYTMQEDSKVKNINGKSVAWFDKDNIRVDGTELKSVIHYNTIKKSIFSLVKDKSYNLEISDKNSNNESDDLKSDFTMITNRNKVKINSLDILNKQFKICSQCSMTFRYKRHLDRHLEGHKKNNCSHCNAKFARRKHLEIHLFRSHGERVTKYPHSCDACSRSFPKRTLLNRHRAKHNYENGKVCSDCGEMVNTEEDDKDRKEHNCAKKQFECKKCRQTFSIEQTYLTHIQNHDNHKCSKCDVTFASKKKVHEHYKMVHSLKLNDDRMANNGIYFCNDCTHTFLKKDDYLRHLGSTSHLSKINREIPLKYSFSCVLCSKKLISQRALDQHVRRIHKVEKKFMCNIYGCTFQCARKSDLDRHKQLHIEERNIVCEQCGKTFTSVSILNDHVLYIHNKERQFICEECGKAFKRNSLLKRHKLSHQQHRPFACTQCNTAFKRSHHLTRHMETCHRVAPEKKRKVVKLMKTEDGHLVPVPEEPRKVKSRKLKIQSGSAAVLTLKKKISPSESTDNANKYFNSSLELQPLLDSSDLSDNPMLSLELINFPPTTDSTTQILSLVDINTEQIVTVEISNSKTLSTNDLIDQFDTNSNEILNFTNYQDPEFQRGILNLDQHFYDHANYSELLLETVEGTSLFVDSNINKVDHLPLENYLNQSFPSFLNI